MKLAKAIKILEERSKARPLLGPHEVYGALQLGIEALKWIQRQRKDLFKWEVLSLPGETEVKESDLPKPSEIRGLWKEKRQIEAGMKLPGETE